MASAERRPHEGTGDRETSGRDSLKVTNTTEGTHLVAFCMSCKGFIAAPEGDDVQRHADEHEHWIELRVLGATFVIGPRGQVGVRQGAHDWAACERRHVPAEFVETVPRRRTRRLVTERPFGLDRRNQNADHELVPGGAR